MFIIMLLSLTATMASVLWSTDQRREEERELANVGRQFQAAIERYHQRRASGTPSAYPASLEALLLDERGRDRARHLRRIYVDPMTRSRDWGLLRTVNGGIVGVFSKSDRLPVEGSPVARDLAFGAARSYRDWRFIAPSAEGLQLTTDARDASAGGASSTSPRAAP